MPDDDWALSQGTVDFRNEERRWSARVEVIPWDEQGEMTSAFCTCDADCHADADQHMENCPVEHQLREEFGGF